MITACVYKTKNGDIFGFKVKNHTDPVICAAVSALVINCANSIKTFTHNRILCKHNEKGGYISIELPDIKNNTADNPDKAQLLLQSLLLGLSGISMEYQGSIKIKEVIK